MQIRGRYAVMLDIHLDNPQYEGQWPIVLIRNSLEDAAASCGSTFVRVNRTVPRGAVDAERVAPFALIDGRSGEVQEGGVFLMTGMSS